MMQPKRYKRHQRGMGQGTHQGEGSWAVSYVDMLTLLLCFFIIFFSTDKNKSAPKTLQAIQSQFTQNPAQEIKNQQPMAPVDPAAPSNTEGTPRIQTIVHELESLRDLYNKKKIEGARLELQFDNISFFDSASTRLTPEGQTAVNQVIETLKPYSGKVRIVVQGHTDSRTLRGSQTGLKDNWELSVIRATSVLRGFNQAGFPQQYLSAEGFAATRTLATVEDYSIARRITLRIEDLDP
jgi:chemotaxis protein MotB